MTHKKRMTVLVLSMSLGMSSISPAHAINPGQLGQIGEIWQFAQQLIEWSKSITDLSKLKDDLFGSTNVQDLGNTLLGKLGDYALANSGIDIKGIMGKTQEFQAKINEIRSKMISEVNKVADLSFMTNAAGTVDSQFGAKAPMAFNPVLTQQRYEGTRGLYNVGVDRQAMVQATADSAKSVQESKKIVEETQKRADTTIENAKSLTTAAQGIQSTREGMEILIRTQAEAITSSTYNAVALTSALSQQVMQSEVTNRTLQTMAEDVMRERAARAQAMVGMIRQRQEEAAKAQVQLQSTMENVTNGMTKTFEVAENDINIEDAF